MKIASFLLAFACLGLIPASCSHSPSTAPEVTPTAGPWTPQKIVRPHLPNTYQLHEKVMVGGQPDGEAGFKELRELGVKTVISVDGARPPVELARKYGLRYVHLPHGYDGIPEGRARELVRAVRDLPGPIYLHCHHGKHRAPAAAAVACVGAGLLKPELALSVLRAAGTSRNYRGLYDAAEKARPWGEAWANAASIEFPETAQVPPLAEAMVAMEHAHDHLKAAEQAEWKSPADHPDLDPPHQALLLREQFTELLRTDEVLRQPQHFQELLRRSAVAAAELEAGLWERSDPQRPATPAVTDSFQRMTNLCAECHARFRDVPLSEKPRQTP